MYKRILVPLDGSKLAEQVLPYVRPLASALKSPVQLLRVFSAAPEGLEDPAHGHYGHQIDAGIRGQAYDYLNQIKASMFDLGVTVSCTVKEGDPATWIAREADQEPDTIVAMSTHGRSGITRWLMGSVTQKVLHAVTCPMLIVRPREQEGSATEVDLNSVIVPLDGSETAEQVLTHVVPLVKPLHLDVLLVRVTPSAEEYHRYMERHTVSSAANVYSGPYEEFAKEADARAMEYLHGIRQNLQRQQIWSINERLMRGHPAETIIRLAGESSKTLVAMTTHGRSGVGRWVLGSVTDRVVRHSDGPVLVVRASS